MKFNMPEDFIKKISSLSDKTDEVIAKCLKLGLRLLKVK